MSIDLAREAARPPGVARAKRYRERPSTVQAAYLSRGLSQPGGKLPLFDRKGQRYKAATIRSCIEQGWAEPWFHNPTHPDWLVCKLTTAGWDVLAALRDEDESTVTVVDFTPLRCRA